MTGEQVGAACGILNAGGNIGGFLAPVLTPYIASQAGWSWGLYAGSLMAIVGVLICAALLTRIEYNKSIVLLIAVAVAFLNWLSVRNRAGR